MYEESNSTSQPIKEMPVFNNWNAIPLAWYCVGSLSDLRKQKVLNTQIGKQELVIFEAKDSSVHCLDAFCSHMGLKLSVGKVTEDGNIQCKFHHWQYNGNGEAFDSGCKKLSSQRNLNSYPTVIRYGLIWVWAGKEANYELPYHPDLGPGSFDYRLGKLYSRPSHPHISLLNALDIQHVNTVHALELNVSARHFEAQDGSFIHYDFEGTFLKSSPRGKRSAWITGGGYQFSVRYAGSTLGYLTALKGIKLFGFIPFPPIFATFGYRQSAEKKTFIQPVFLSPKRKGFFGGIKTWMHLKLTETIYNKLKNEDGEIYENIRFTPNLTAEDDNVGSFIAHVNRLPKSSF